MKNITAICDGPGAYCFESAMMVGYSDCACMDNCNEVLYIISDMSILPTNQEKECTRTVVEESYKTGFYYNTEEDQNIKKLKTSNTIDRLFSIPVLVAEKLR